MADLYQTISGLQPNQQDIIEAELLARQIIEAQFPDIDLREGTALRDLVLRPSAYILALCKKGSDTYFSENTLAAANDDTPHEVIDGLLSNWFLDRNPGTYAVINARLYFARQKNITLPTGSSFSPDGIILFYPLKTEVFTSAGLQFDSSSNEWYVDVDLQAAETGSAYNLSTGSLLYFSTFDPYFLRAEINYLVSESKNAETNEEFIERAQTAISTRNLINQPSIISRMQETFNYVPRITVVGAKDEDMFRDQVKLVFDPEKARAVTALSYSSGTVTATLADHGYYSGQPVIITGATPSGYNGSYTITVTGTNTFTFPLGSNPGTAVVFPTVQSVTTPIYAHLGGCVDIYCGDETEEQIVQLTLDNTGYSEIEGPVFKVERSEISGGASDDTMPASYPLSFTSPTYNTSTNRVTVTAAAHGLTGSFNAQVSGINQTRTISTVSCNNKVVTVVTDSAHGLVNGDMVRVGGVFPIEYSGDFQVTVVNSTTFTYVSEVDIYSAGSGTTMTIQNPWLVGLLQATVVDANSFYVSLPNLWGGASPTGTLAIGYVPSYTLFNPSLMDRTVTALSCVGNQVTAVSKGHGLVPRRFVKISGAAVTGYNGTWQIDEIVDDNTVTFTIDSVGLANDTAATLTYCSPSKDVGFSERQVIGIQFPVSQAGKTVSFVLSRFKNLDSIQEYFDSPSNKVLCAGYLARGFNIYVLDVDLIVYNGPAPSSGSAATAIDTFFKSMSPGAPLLLSDIVTTLADAGIENLQTPIGVEYTFYHRDLVTPMSGTITDYLDPRDDTSVFILRQVTTSAASV